MLGISIQTGPLKESWAFKSVLAQREDSRTFGKSYSGSETLSSYFREYVTRGKSRLGPRNTNNLGPKFSLAS
jgi:hypothetical protein